ncbi:MAG TPA: alpha/beta fold hydrolase [Candidatus Dormibacteraeota bacterium]|nr:alpha/beta fold hydrolase [Candidatus Dormibacteraeota bacterium]
MKLGVRVLAAVLAFWLVASFAGERISLEPPRSKLGATPSRWGMAYSDVTFRSADGITLSGWWIPGTDHSTVVMVHGLGSNRDEPLSRSAYLHEAGYNVLVFDLRGQGLSGGAGTTMGYREPQDVRAAVAEARSLDSGRIALFGYSLGAASAIEEAANDPDVSAVIEDSGFTSAADVILARFSHVTRLPAVPFAAAVLAFSTIDFGTSPWNVRPVAMAATLHKPLLVIIGGADTIVPPAEGEAIFRAAAGPKQLLEVPGAGHVQAYYTAPALYQATVLRFLEPNLKG